MGLIPSVSVSGLVEVNQNLILLNRSLAELSQTLTSSFISLSADNTFTGTNTFTKPPLIDAGLIGTGTLHPMGLMSSQSSIAGIGNAADLTDDVLFTYSLPANSFDQNNRAIIIEAFGKFAANGNNKTVKLWFGASISFTSGVVATNNAGWSARLIVMRTGASTQKGQGVGMGGSALWPLPIPLAGTETDTGAITLRVTGASPTTGAANDVVANGMMVTYLN